MKPQKEFATLLKEVRTDLDMTQVEFSKLLGIGQGLLSKLENAQMTTKYTVLMSLARNCADEPAVKAKVTHFLFNGSKLDT